jgi:toxin ParE1/3/4
MRRPHSIILSPGALADLEQIGAHIALDSPERARAFVDTVLDRIAGLAMLPERFPDAPESPLDGVHLRQMIVKPYRVVYEVLRREVRVVRVRHAARSPLQSLDDA